MVSLCTELFVCVPVSVCVGFIFLFFMGRSVHLVVFSLAFPLIQLLSMMCSCLTFIKDQNQQKFPIFSPSLLPIFVCVFACSLTRIANISAFLPLFFRSFISLYFLPPFLSFILLRSQIYINFAIG